VLVIVYYLNGKWNFTSCRKKWHNESFFKIYPPSPPKKKMGLERCVVYGRWY